MKTQSILFQNNYELNVLDFGWVATNVDKTACISISFIKILNSKGLIMKSFFGNEFFSQIGANTTVLKGGFLSSWLTGLQALGGRPKVYLLVRLQDVRVRFDCFFPVNELLTSSLLQIY